MNKHEDTFLKREELGSRIPKYQPTFNFQGEYIDEAHRYFAECPVASGILVQVREPQTGSIIEGALRREDALKLYEIGYCVSGDILELGCSHGLSTCILAQANSRSPVKKHIYTVDLNPACVESTKQNLQKMGLANSVTAVCSDATAAVKKCADERKSFDFVFIDHTHAYEPVLAVCRVLRNIVSEGGFCLFHDFNDARNKDDKNPDYGVYTAVMDGLNQADFEFYGVYGCTALYRKGQYDDVATPVAND